MNIIAETKNAISKAVDELKVLTANETEDAPLSEEQEARVDELTKSVKFLTKKLDRQKSIEKMDIAKARRKKDEEDDDKDDETKDSDDDDDDEDMSKASDDEDDDKDDDKKKGKKSVFPVSKSVWEPARSNVVLNHKRTQEEKAMSAINFIIGCGVAKSFNSVHAASNWARYDAGDVQVAKALNSLQQITGGALVPQDMWGDIVPLLYSDTVFRGNGVPIYPMPRGNATLPRMVAGANAFWIGELDAIPVSQQKMSDLQLFRKILVAMTPVTVDLIQFAIGSVQQIILTDLREQIALTEDMACLLSPGTSAAKPIGLAALAAQVSVMPALPAATGTNGAQVFQAVMQQLVSLKLQLTSQNISTSGAKWIMPYSVVAFLSALGDGFGRPFFFQNGQQTLLDLPVIATNLIPTNGVVASGTATVGGGTRAAQTTDNTSIFLVNWPDLIMADVMGLVTDSSDVASYESGGVVTSAYQNRQILFRSYKEMDFNVRRPQSIVAAQVTGYTPNGYTPNNGLVYLGAPVSTTPSFAGSANPVTTNPTVAANTAATVTANSLANMGAPGNTQAPNSTGDAYEGG